MVGTDEREAGICHRLFYVLKPPPALLVSALPSGFSSICLSVIPSIGQLLLPLCHGECTGRPTHCFNPN